MVTVFPDTVYVPWTTSFSFENCFQAPFAASILISWDAAIHVPLKASSPLSLGVPVSHPIKKPVYPHKMDIRQFYEILSQIHIFASVICQV
jgi:hypothetical protein